ncbi:MAG: glutamyl-tRNA reductase [Beutenbergiaceae bacterium]
MLLCLSASHRGVGFEVLQRLSGALPPQWVPSSARGLVRLATCNRFEVYLDLEQATEPSLLRRQLAVAAGLDAQELTGMQIIEGNRVSAHLFAVACGLESMVFGEREIAGQVRRALIQAHEHSSATRALDRLFQAAIATSREVRMVSGIGSGGPSVIQLALDVSAGYLGRSHQMSRTGCPTDHDRHSWDQCRALIVGSGSHARAIAAALTERGTDTIRAWSPTGQRLPHPEVQMVADTELSTVLADVDLVLTSTTGQAVTAAMVQEARIPATTAPLSNPAPLTSVAPGTGPLLVVDLGLPANVDPQVGALPGVRLLDLPSIGRHAPLPDVQASAHAYELVESAATAFEASALAAPVVTVFRDHVEQLLQAELQRLRSRRNEQPTDLAEQALRHFAQVLVHGPSMRAHSLAADGRLAEVEAAVEALYEISARSA